MANVIRSCKSGRDWTTNELFAYRVNITNKNDIEFFGFPLDNIEVNVPDGVLNSLNKEDTPDDSYKFIALMEVAMSLNENEESAVDDFTVEILRLLRYETRGRLIRTRKDIPLFMCGRNTHAKTDVCVITDTQILLIIQENKSHFNRHSDPEPQLIAEAIAAFQHNNRYRRELDLDEIDFYEFPCIIMRGTYPTFYKIPVTRELDNCIRFGEHPNIDTNVARFNPVIGLRRYSNGMKPLPERLRILKTFQAFKDFL